MGRWQVGTGMNHCHPLSLLGRALQLASLGDLTSQPPWPVISHVSYSKLRSGNEGGK